jgi:hypothetical protein
MASAPALAPIKALERLFLAMQFRKRSKIGSRHQCIAEMDKNGINVGKPS